MTDWLSTREAAIALGVSHGQMLRLRDQDVFKSGKHYRKKNPIAARPSYVWHIDRCGDALSYEPKPISA